MDEVKPKDSKQVIYSPDYMRVKHWRGGNRARYNEYMREYRKRKRGDHTGSDGVQAEGAAGADTSTAKEAQIRSSGLSQAVWEDCFGGESSD